MCLPVYAALEWGRVNGQHLAGGYVLVADTDGQPPQALRSQFARLARLQLMTGTSAPVLAIATTSDRRVKAWTAVLESIAARPSRGSLETCIDTWDAGVRRAVLVDQQPPLSHTRGSELLKRLQADECELCGSTVRVEVHHLHKMADLNRHRRRPVATWFRLMATRKRKTLIACRACHEAIHADDQLDKLARDESLESRARGKLAHAVRRGADGKNPRRRDLAGGLPDSARAGG